MIDLIAYADRVPGPGETLIGQRFQMGFGGKGANQAVMARLLGAEVAMINCLGDDAYGDMTLENFASFGIDTSHVSRVSGSSGVAPIWVEPGGTNRIIIVPGANHALTSQQAAHAIDELSEVATVVGQLEIPQSVTAAGFGAARHRGAITVLNPAPAAELVPELIAVTDWLTPNEIEFEMLAGRSAADDAALREYANETRTRLIVTLGDAGCGLVTAEGEVIRIAANDADAIDTTGAGDAFVGAFAFGLAVGLEELDAIRLGNRCAGDSVTRAGTQSSFPDPARCGDFLAEIRRADR
jgi:ribokinase